VNPVPIQLDDFGRSRDELIPAARRAVDDLGDDIAAKFLAAPADYYEPVAHET
jgi:hypothetical protein